ncbi:MAG TPA: hypothetical protein VFH68_13815 [Polyangia bacterium]|jgi:hypothetical protein|nr:hypothetical protein [Polyangia bacterium]
MEHALTSPLAAWESFYVIVGSSAAALTGLQFVVIVLVADVSAPASVHSTRAFGTPTVVHFCAVLLNSALLSAPWRQISNVALAIAAFGLAGLGYTMLVLRHARRQTDYVPVLEDWIWHIALPLFSYAALLVAGILLPRESATCLFIIGGTALLLLFIGIHNAWDSVTYIALQRRQGPAAETGEAGKRGEPRP